MQAATIDASFAVAEFDAHALIERAAEDVRGGRLTEAETAYAAIVKERPDLPDAWFLYGLTAFETGNLDAAIERLRRAAGMRRAEPRYRVALARACLDAGHPDEAFAALEAAIRVLPDAPDINAILGRACLALGMREQAANYSKRAFAAALRVTLRRQRRALTGLTIPLRAALAAPARNTVPWVASLRYETAVIAERYRASDEAGQLYQEAAALAPDWASPLVQLGRMAFETEQFVAARGFLEQACARAPQDIEALAEYGRTLSRMAFHEEAFEVHERAYALAPESTLVRRQLGWTNYRASNTHTALEHFAAVLVAEPRDAESHFGTAQCHVDLGDTQSSIEWLHRTLALRPGHAGAFRGLANLKALAADDPRLTTLERLANAPEPNIRRRGILNMALGEVYRNQGDAERAFRHYATGNALKDVTFDISTHRTYIDRIRRQFDGGHFEQIAGSGEASEVPVFIVGMPRSGTSLIEQILASHPAVHGAGEREEFPRLAMTLGDVIGDAAAYPECAARLGTNDINRMAAEQFEKLRALAPDSDRITDKMPGNFLHLGLIATLFPNARIIHCRRDPLDVCLSIYFGEFAGHHAYSYDLENLGLYYREYERIMAHWSQTLPLRIFDVRYEDVVDDVAGMTRRLLDFCGLPWDAGCLEFHNTKRTVHTRSNAQVRQPIYRSSCGRWRPYARYLEPLADALGGDQPARLFEAIEG